MTNEVVPYPAAGGTARRPGAGHFEKERLDQRPAQLSDCLAKNGVGARDPQKDARIAEISAEIKRLR
jgi:hypothetical protein